MATAPATTSPARSPAAKSRRRLLHRAVSAPLRAVPRSRNGPPSGGDNVWATRASTFDIGHQPLELRAKGASLRLVLAAMIATFHWPRYGGRRRPQAPRGSSPFVKVSRCSRRRRRRCAAPMRAHVRARACGCLTPRRGTDREIGSRNPMPLCAIQYPRELPDFGEFEPFRRLTIPLTVSPTTSEAGEERYSRSRARPP